MNDGNILEHVYHGDLVVYPGAWSFGVEKSHLILVSDQDLVDLCTPDTPVNLALTHEPRTESLRQVCERAAAQGQRTLILAYDHFFAQYRPGQHVPRRLTPDMPEYVDRIATISSFVQDYGLALELSLLSPLEIGPAYRARTGECGLWMQARKGLRDPRTGAFSVALWQQKRWVNNKGMVELEDAGVRVFAFRETALHGTPYRAVDPASLYEITAAAHIQCWPGLASTSGEYRAERVCVSSEGPAGGDGLDRVLVVQMYRVPEMDYFSVGALPFLQEMTESYVRAGVQLTGLYSDEMHIQGDWSYGHHHDHGEFTLRYVSDGLARQFAARYGAEYADLARYMLYFVRGQEDSSNDLSAKAGVMHVFGETPEAVRVTALFRARYYHFLQDGVVDLFMQAKRYLERRVGHRLETRAHATWAESPTCDYWVQGTDNANARKYEYTADFVWSNTVHQAASACYDYFKWGDYLTGTGNDHAEGGWLDRNYVGLALACSTGILNEIPYSYAAHWGMPEEISQRRGDLVNAYGAAGSPLFGLVQEMQHRDVEVLMLYPLDLVALDERFGSWMTQYGYATQISAAKLLELGKVRAGRIEIAGRTFTTLVTLCEPFPARALLDLMRAFAESGGRLIWSGPPPVVTAEGDDALGAWQDLFGCRYAPGLDEGIMAAGRRVTYEGVLAGVGPQTILTSFLVDRVYPVALLEGTRPVASVKKDIVGVHRLLASGGSATFLGYRPRDDQSGSLGYETRAWFEVLTALGAYPPTGRFAENDNTEYISRTTAYLCCRFPNGAVTIAPHLREIEESWPGGFARDQEHDQAVLRRIALPSRRLALQDVAVNGHRVTYTGEGAVAFRVDEQGTLLAFAGSGATEITVDGRRTVFAEGDGAELAWAPVPSERRVAGGALLQIKINSAGRFRIPMAALPPQLQLISEGAAPGSRGVGVPLYRTDDVLQVTITSELAGRWIYGVAAE